MSVKSFFLFLISILFITPSFAQEDYLESDTIPFDTSAYLSAYVDTINALSDSMLDSYDFDRRITAAYGIIPRLVSALQYDWELAPNLDSLRRISVVRSPDNKVRVFTWQLNLSNGRARHFGAIQKKNKDSLELYPLFDASDFIDGNIQDTLLYSDEWLGCLYYNIIQREIEGKDFYFLFGFDVKDNSSNIKLIDVLEFHPEDEWITFGKPIWYHTKQGEVPENINYKKPKEPKIAYRFMIEYFEASTVILNWDSTKTAIVYDQLEPLNEYSWDVKATYCPTGRYESLVFDQGKWLPKGRVFNFISQDPPLPVPVVEDKMQTLIPKERLEDPKNRIEIRRTEKPKGEKEESETEKPKQ